MQVRNQGFGVGGSQGPAVDCRIQTSCAPACACVFAGWCEPPAAVCPCTLACSHTHGPGRGPGCCGVAQLSWCLGHLGEVACGAADAHMCEVTRTGVCVCMQPLEQLLSRQAPLTPSSWQACMKSSAAALIRIAWILADPCVASFRLPTVQGPLKHPAMAKMLVPSSVPS